MRMLYAVNAKNCKVRVCMSCHAMAPNELTHRAHRLSAEFASECFALRANEAKSRPLQHTSRAQVAVLLVNERCDCAQTAETVGDSICTSSQSVWHSA